MNLKIQSFTTESEWLEARKGSVTTTEVAALFGLSPYQTAFELFHRKRDASLVEAFDNERMKWGQRLQPVIAAGVCEDSGWTITHDGDRCFVSHPTVKGFGASFDYVVKSALVAEGPRDLSPGALEIKNVDGLIFRNDWISDSEGSEAPPHIELQLQAQLECLDLEWGCIAALVGGNKPVVILRDRDREVGAAIVAQVQAFWQRIADNNPPPPDFQADAAFISRLYGYAEPGKVLDLAKVVAGPKARIGELVTEYEAGAKQEKAGKDAKEAAKAELLTLMGEHERVAGEGFTISAGMVGPCRVEYDRAGYRNFRVTRKKESKK